MNNPILSFDQFTSTVFEATCDHLFQQNEFFKNYELLEKTFGFDQEECQYLLDFNDMTEEQKKRALDKFKSDGFIYSYLKELYDYAVDGIPGHNHWEDLIQTVGEYIDHVRTTDVESSKSMELICEMGLLRFGMDGVKFLSYLEFETSLGNTPISVIAAMANLDERTVRNAASEGLFRDEGGEFNTTAIKVWLSNKKGFKRSQIGNNQSDMQLSEVGTTGQFALLIQQQKNRLEKLFDEKKFYSRHFTFKKNTLSDLENGIFNLPLNSVGPISEAFYFDRADFLQCVMRVFFPYELAMLMGGENG